METVLLMGGDPNATSADGGHTALHNLARMDVAEEGTQLEVSRLLLERGGDPRIQDRDGNSVLHLMANRAPPALLRMLVARAHESRTSQDDAQAGDVLCLRNKEGRTAADIARKALDKAEAYLRQAEAVGNLCRDDCRRSAATMRSRLDVLLGQPDSTVGDPMRTGREGNGLPR